MTPAELVATASPKIGSLGAAFYFAPETVAVGKEHGLDGFRFYILGRGGVLGDAEAPVITSAFGYWNPELITKMWDSGREKMSPRDAGRLYVGCAQDFGRRTFAGVAGLDAYNAAAAKVVAAANPAGLALFAGLAAEPLADDAPARAMQLTAVLREFRGSAHLLAVLASGLEPRLAHAIRRPEMVKTFGWGEDPIPSTAADRACLDASEALTDQLVLPAFSTLSSEEGEALVAGLDGMAATLG
jgi:hypothetical protein